MSRCGIGDTSVWGRVPGANAVRLRGHVIKRMCAGYDKCIVLADSWSFIWQHAEKNAQLIEEALQDVKLCDIAFGRDNAVGLSLDGTVFTWGDGENGQLGAGGRLVRSEAPVLVKALVGKLVRQVAAGHSHCAALTDNGDLFTWGRGFEGQTGHTAAHGDMAMNDAIAGVQLTPKYVQGLLGHPVHAVGCGEHFTVALTGSGAYAWGAGECGQLGCGRVTKQRTPCHVLAACLACQGRLAEVKCGWAHTLVRCEAGHLMAWGFNRFGQLGLGDTDTRFEPALLELPEGVVIAEMSVNGHYSVALSEAGELFTWGSGSHGRLGHEDSENRLVPTRVERLVGSRVCQLAAVAEGMLVFVPACVNALEPPLGPVGGNTPLLIRGAGFWDGEDITVRFTPVSGDGGVRVSLGTYDHELGAIRTRVPKFQVPGEVVVEVGLNGRHFTVNNQRFAHYNVPRIFLKQPAFGPMEGGAEIRIVGDAFVESSSIVVKFVERADTKAQEDRAKFLMPAQLLRFVEEVEEENPETREMELIEIVKQYVTCASPAHERARQLPMECQVAISFNGVDFGPIVNNRFVLHNALVSHMAPSAGHIDGGTRVRVKGRSFFPCERIRVCFSWTEDGEEKQLFVPGEFFNKEEIHCTAPRPGLWDDRKALEAQRLAALQAIADAANAPPRESDELSQASLSEAGMSDSELDSDAEDAAAAGELAEGDEEPADGEDDGGDEGEANGGDEDADGADSEGDAAGDEAADADAASADGGDGDAGSAAQDEAEPEPEEPEELPPVRIFATAEVYYGDIKLPGSAPFTFFRIGNVELTPTCGPVSGGTAMSFSADWLFDSEHVKAKLGNPFFAGVASGRCAAVEMPGPVEDEAPEDDESSPEAEASSPEASPEAEASPEVEEEKEGEGEGEEPVVDEGPKQQYQLQVVTPAFVPRDPAPTAETAPVGDGESGEEGGNQAEEEPVEVDPLAKYTVSVCVALNGADFAQHESSFRYYEDPTMSALKPDSAAAGTDVTIQGSGFFDSGCIVVRFSQPGGAVQDVPGTFNPANSFVTCTVPPQPEGVEDPQWTVQVALNGLDFPMVPAPSEQAGEEEDGGGSEEEAGSSEAAAEEGAEAPAVVMVPSGLPFTYKAGK